MMTVNEVLAPLIGPSLIPMIREVRLFMSTGLDVPILIVDVGGQWRRFQPSGEVATQLADAIAREIDAWTVRPFSSSLPGWIATLAR